MTEKKNLVVQNTILSLEETLSTFENAALNIGMRFHSVVFQTLVNGKNLVLNYTQKSKGKITGFITDIHAIEHYKDKMVSLQEDSNYESILSGVENIKAFRYDAALLESKLDVYRDLMKSM